MELALIKRLIAEDDPLRVLFEVLSETIWTGQRFFDAEQRNELKSYLQRGEHEASILEHDVYDVFGDVYGLLETEDPRRDRVRELHSSDQYALLLIDALSLREAPIIQSALANAGRSVAYDFALAPVPTETSDFCRRNYNASGPSEMVGRANQYPFAFRHVTSESWQPNFAPDERRRFVWLAFPDDYFTLKETDYTRHVFTPIQRILESILADPTLPKPLVITGDHGYIWQGGNCSWPLAPEQRTLFAEHFKLGRARRNPSEALASTGKVWVQGNMAAARGRFGWGGAVTGSGSLFKHGGVSLMECLVPYIVAE